MLAIDDDPVAKDVVHVWFAAPSPTADSTDCQLSQHLGVLSAEERQRYAAFRFHKDHIHYLIRARAAAAGAVSIR